MIESWWRLICGVHLDDDGTLAAVWMAHDEQTSVVHIYDCALFKDTQNAVIVDGITARGRSIPVAWRKHDKPIADDLYEHGIDILPDPVEETEGSIARGMTNILQHLNGQRLRVDKRVRQWFREYELFWRDGRGALPAKGFPLMAATRHALDCLEWAEARESSVMQSTENHPNIQVV